MCRLLGMAACLLLGVDGLPAEEPSGAESCHGTASGIECAKAADCPEDDGAPATAETAQAIADAFVAEGRRYLAAGECHTAIAFFDSALRRDPQSHAAYAARALAHVRMGDYRSALLESLQTQVMIEQLPAEDRARASSGLLSEMRQELARGERPRPTHQEAEIPSYLRVPIHLEEGSRLDLVPRRPEGLLRPLILRLVRPEGDVPPVDPSPEQRPLEFFDSIEKGMQIDRLQREQHRRERSSARDPRDDQ